MAKKSVAPKPANAEPQATKLSDIVVRHRASVDGRVMREVSGETLGALLDVVDDEYLKKLVDPEEIGRDMRHIAGVLESHSEHDDDVEWCYWLADQLKLLADRVDHLRVHKSEHGFADHLDVEPKAVA